MIFPSFIREATSFRTMLQSCSPAALICLATGCGSAAVSPQPPPALVPAPPSTVPEMPPTPRECTNERELAINKGFSSGASPLLVHEWAGEPFRFYWDSSIPEDLRGPAEQALEEVRALSEAIKDQIGYSILEVGGWIDEADRGFEFSEENITRCEGFRHAQRASVARAVPGRIVATVHPNELPWGAAARPHCAVIFWTAGRLDEETYVAVTHETFHLFGFVHSPEVTRQSQAAPGEGVQMSRSLSDGSPASLGGITYDDIDALRCIFPKR